MFRQIGLAGSVPRCTELSFANWWRKIIRTEKKHRKGLNSLIILGAWIIWKHSVDAELDYTPAELDYTPAGNQHDFAVKTGEVYEETSKG